MALNAQRLAENLENINNDMNEDLPDEVKEQIRPFIIRFAEAIVNEVKEAQAIGSDTGGDSHNLTIQ